MDGAVRPRPFPIRAGIKSGALLTARYALANGRRVLAVPNSIYSPESMGTNQLILQGIPPYLSPEQLLGKETTAGESQYIPKPKPSQTAATSSPAQIWTPLQAMIIRMLYKAPYQVEEMALELKVDRTALLEELWPLEVTGYIRLQGSRVELAEADLTAAEVIFKQTDAGKCVG